MVTTRLLHPSSKTFPSPSSQAAALPSQVPQAAASPLWVNSSPVCTSPGRDRSCLIGCRGSKSPGESSPLPSRWWIRDRPFEDTIFDNLTMWDKSIDEATVIQACKDAQIHEDIMGRAGGYAHIIREGARTSLGAATATGNRPGPSATAHHPDLG